ncbi:MAG TPA: hypothetical protein DHV63_02990 [Pseudomonas sp.]|nr:hypothetical protein [Pseudomonas sp.]
MAVADCAANSSWCGLESSAERSDGQFGSRCLHDRQTPARESPFRVHELIRTRPEGFDFRDAPDTRPLSQSYEADLKTRLPAWTTSLIKRLTEN